MSDFRNGEKRRFYIIQREKKGGSIVFNVVHKKYTIMTYDFQYVKKLTNFFRKKKFRDFFDFYITSSDLKNANLDTLRTIEVTSESNIFSLITRAQSISQLVARPFVIVIEISILRPWKWFITTYFTVSRYV